MLVKVTVETRSFKKVTSGVFYVLATEYISDAKTVETTKTQFTYPLVSRDLRTLPEVLKVTEGIADIKTAFAATWQNNYVDLPVFPDNDPTQSAVTQTYAKENIRWAEAKNSTTSWVYIRESGNVVKKKLVDYNLDQIVDVADTGATTTTTT